ncbi:MAG: HAD family hydrolase [Mycoplasma sp.]
MNKFFIFDLDGTLLNSQKKISEENVNAIKKLILNNHHVAIATGRNLSQIQEYIKILDNVRYFVVLNGGAIWDNHKKQIKYISQPLDKEIVDYVLSHVKDIKRELQFSNFDRLYRVYFGNNIFEDIKEPNFFKDATKNPVFDNWNDVSHLLDGPIIRVAIRCEKEHRKNIMKSLKERFKHNNSFHITESSNTYVEVDPASVSKFNTIKTVLDKYSINIDDVIAFGDSENDISILSSVNNAIVMGNSNDEVKKHANIIIGDNNSNAIAEFLNTFIK